MKAKRMLSLLLTAALMLSMMTPAFAAAAQTELPLASQTQMEETNEAVSIRLQATGKLVYGSPFELSVVTRPADVQYIGVVLGVKGEAKGYVTLVLSDKLRTLLKMIPLPRKMSKTPDQVEEFNVYAYVKQLIDGNDVSVLLSVADEVVKVMDALKFYIPTLKDMSLGLKLSLEMIRRYLPEGVFSRIYLDEQPVDSGRYIAGAVALQSGDLNTAGVAMFRIKPKTEGVRLYWAEELPAVTLAEAESPMTIWVPRMTLTRSDEGLTTTFVPRDEYPNFAGNKSQLFQVVCFEDSRRGDYDYNDLVIHVLYQTRQNIFGFGVQPVALGSTKSIKLGCVVYKGGKRVFKGLITPDGADCRSQYFKSMEGTLNTYDKANIKVGEYLGSTIRNWDVSKIEGDGVMRVEWYIEVDNGVELYALSTAYLNDSFDKDKLPYGLVITTTGTEYVDEKGGYLCGFDWFNYPRESVHIKEVYPEMWNWLTTDNSYNFADIYDGRNVPANACPAADLGLFEARTIDVTNRKYRAD